MSNGKSNRGLADSQTINVNYEYGVQYLSAALGVSEKKLRETVDGVGVKASDVREALGKE